MAEPYWIDEPHEVTFLYQQLLNQANDDWHSVVSKRDSKKTRTSGERGVDDEEQETDFDEEPLISQSSMSYEVHGVEIKGIEVLNAAGDVSSLLSQGEPFSLRFTYQASDCFDDAVFTCYITSHTGIHVSGQSLPAENNSGVTIQAGTTFTITFSFEGRIWPGLYFVGGGIASPTSSYRFLHRVVDWAVFRMQSRNNLRSHGASQLSSSTPTLQMTKHHYQKPESAA